MDVTEAYVNCTGWRSPWPCWPVPGRPSCPQPGGGAGQSWWTAVRRAGVWCRWLSSPLWPAPPAAPAPRPPWRSPARWSARHRTTAAGQSAPIYIYIYILYSRTSNLIRTIFLCDLLQMEPFCYYNVGMQEFCVISCGKGCLCDGCLWIITEAYNKSQKRPKLITKMCQEIP